MDPRDYWANIDSDFEFNEKKSRIRTKVMNEDGEEFEIELRAHYEVCDLCEGKGSHVNPSIDAGGISGDTFRDDPDFFEEYTSGVYDVTCHQCKGKRVYPQIDCDYYESNNATESEKENYNLYNSKIEDRHEMIMESYNERKYLYGY